jgi:hypothetical protein
VAKPVCRIADCSNNRLNVSRKRHSSQGNVRFEFLAVVNKNNLVCEATLCNLLLTDTFFRNVNKFLPDYTVLYPRKCFYSFRGRLLIACGIINKDRYQWPRCLRRGSVDARFLRLWVRIPPATWMFLSSECCMLSDRGLCVELITHPEKSYRL